MNRDDDTQKRLKTAWEVAQDRMSRLPSIRAHAASADERALKVAATKPSPKEPDPFQKEFDDAWVAMLKRSEVCPATEEKILTAHEGAIKAASVRARRGAWSFTAARAVKLKAPEVQRGTPLVDPGDWRRHVEDLGLPTGTPPPTVRIVPEVRELLSYPGQPEVVEGILSALQQFDGTILASRAGEGRTSTLAAVAAHLLGSTGDKVGLFVTTSAHLIREAGGFVEAARMFGILDVDALPSDMKDLQTGMYVTTYAEIRGDQNILTIPWDFVLFDESSEARNWTRSELGKSVVLLGHAAKKVVYSSLTPYKTVMQMGYLHKLGLWPRGGFFEWAQQFGSVQSIPNRYFSYFSAARPKLTRLRQQLIERGQWQKLPRDLSEGDVDTTGGIAPMARKVFLASLLVLLGVVLAFWIYPVMWWAVDSINTRMIPTGWEGHVYGQFIPIRYEPVVALGLDLALTVACLSGALYGKALVKRWQEGRWTTQK